MKSEKSNTPVAADYAIISDCKSAKFIAPDGRANITAAPSHHSLTYTK